MVCLKHLKLQISKKKFMKAIFGVLLSVIFISSLSTVYAQESEPLILEQLSPSGQVLVKLEWPEVYPHELNQFKVSFHDPNTGELLDDLRLNYDIEVSQHDHTVEFYKQNLATDGTGEFEVLFPEESQGLAQVVVKLRASSHTDGEVIKYFEDVTFSVNVVPEFGVIAAVILSIAFVPILLLSKSKLMPKF